MPRFNVTFTQYYSYEVEADDEYEAENEAYKEFKADMCSPIANTHYDECEVEEIDGE